jgi:glycosyltransferase involved in cell wall biosynthesis
LVPEAIGQLCRLNGRVGIPHSTWNDWAKQRISTSAARSVRRGDRLVLAREFEAREVFQQAAQWGISRLYQLPTPHYATVDHVLRRELAAFPDDALMEEHNRSVAPLRIDRKKAELQLASRILVPSDFVKTSLLAAGIKADRIEVLPFGTEADWISDEMPAKSARLVLHVGQLSIRKGTHRLLRAWKKIGAYHSCELRLIGTMRLSPQFLSEFAGMYNYVGRLPRRSLREHYSTAAFFVLPALAEGFSVVILESLSCGTPVVASRNSGAEGFIREQEEGLLHDAQDDEQLCNALEWMLTNSHRRRAMSENCLQRAKNWTWRHYRAAFLRSVQELVGDADHHHGCTTN